MHVSLEEAARLLNHSHPVAIPTETVWGLAALANDPLGIDRIFSLKGRPRNNPLIIHVSDQSQVVSVIAEQPKYFHDLMEAFWPGSLTLVVPVKKELVLEEVRSSLPTAAFRMPNHPTTLELISEVGPLVAPSANTSGLPSATSMQHVELDFGPKLPILVSHDVMKGIESTILVWTDSTWCVGRLGAIPIEDLGHLLGYLPKFHTPGKTSPICPGQLYRHYAPKARLILSKDGWNPKDHEIYDAVVGFSDRSYDLAPYLFALGESTNPKAIEQNLYHTLRQLDQYGLQNVFVDFDIPNEASYLAIIDRLSKAASR